jgi:hypothetical protein
MDPGYRRDDGCGGPLWSREGDAERVRAVGSVNRLRGALRLEKNIGHSLIVIPAKAGIHLAASGCSVLEPKSAAMDPGFRRDDGCDGLVSARSAPTAT